MRVPLVLATAAPHAGREGVRRLRARQDEALRAAARAAGAEAPSAFPRDAGGAPLPFCGGFFWSAANTRGAALAAVAGEPVGVDLEALARPRVPPAAAFADARELALHAGPWSAGLALALWAAKEAVLKLAGVGVAELRACRLAEPPAGAEPGELLLEHRGRRVRARLLRAEGFLLALACARAEAAPELSVLAPAGAAAEARR
jgi:hypothetical protein